MDRTMDNKIFVDINEILDILPHRYPFLLIDKVVELVKSKSIIALKNVTINENFFTGHFPSSPTMPGVLIIEAMAQAAAILVARSLDNPSKDAIPYLVGIDKARFRRVVVPGDTLTISLSITKKKGSIWVVGGNAKVDKEVAADATLMAVMKTEA